MDFSGIVRAVRGALVPGRIKMQPDFVAFKASGSDEILRVEKGSVNSAHWSRAARGFMLKLLTDETAYKFCGFQDSDFSKLSEYVSNTFSVKLENVEMCVRGINWGELQFHGPMLRFMSESKPIFEITLNDVSNVTTGKNEMTMQFHQNDHAPVSLMEMRFHVPASAAGDGSTDPLQALKEEVLSKADIMEASGDAIATFYEVHCLTPRGRYTIKAYPTFLEMHGKTFDYKLPYSTILQLVLLPHNDGRSMFFVLGLDPPIRQGQTMYPFVILSFPSDTEIDLTLTLTEEELGKYEGKLSKEMSGSLYEVFSRVTRALVGKKIAVPGKFKTQSGLSSISCGHKSNTGFLYPLDKGFIFVHKPTLYIKYDQIACINFARVSHSRTFDLEVDLRNGNCLTFSSIMKNDYGNLCDFVTERGIKVKKMKGQGSAMPEYGDSDGSMSEHDAYLQRVKAEGEERDSEDEDSDFVAGESGSDKEALEYDESAEDSDESKASDGGAAIPKKKPPTSQSTGVKRSQTKSPKEAKPAKRTKKDPNAPKKSLSAYMLWLQEMRPSLKKKYPTLTVPEMGKKAGELWKGVTDKSKWEQEAKEKKAEYQQKLAEYKASGGSSSVQKTIVPAAKKSTATAKKTTALPKKQAAKRVSTEKIKSEEFVDTSSEEEEEEKKPAAASSRSRRSQGTAKEDLVELSEGSHVEEESEAEMSSGDDDDDDDDD